MDIDIGSQSRLCISSPRYLGTCESRSYILQGFDPSIIGHIFNFKIRWKNRTIASECSSACTWQLINSISVPPPHTGVRRLISTIGAAFAGFLSTLWRSVRCLLDVSNRPLIIDFCVLLVRVCGICVVHLFRA
ncbi:hypothetical protein BKA59DRAFT_60232 [Fusarium tricinctum]|uniref:Uncharacterized protein n=1 Tax=Fusarium tricinctum TaxID=61284 RepID=A0A8K0SB95_9HYPO|nr:hypothetical protein BKA59DRAFT_60232 [Fusarium tricinctum]